MIVWAVTGLLVGWILSARLRVDGLGVFLVSSAALAVAATAVNRRYDPDLLFGFAAYWLMVQSTYFLGNLLTEHLKPAPVETSGAAGSFETARLRSTAGFPSVTDRDWDGAGGSRRSSPRSPG